MEQGGWRFSLLLIASPDCTTPSPRISSAATVLMSAYTKKNKSK
jgi:hypothetical protein